MMGTLEALVSGDSLNLAHLILAMTWTESFFNGYFLFVAPCSNNEVHVIGLEEVPRLQR